MARPVLPLRRLTTYYTYKQSYHLQVYERAAIERHLSQSKGTAIDPISRQALPNRELTPVYILRSRATEFREHTARQNLERACSAACLDPVCSLGAKILSHFPPQGHTTSYGTQPAHTAVHAAVPPATSVELDSKVCLPQKSM